jgi:hypothetical protein
MSKKPDPAPYWTGFTRAATVAPIVPASRPAMAAAAGVTGHLTDVRELM